MLENSHTMGIRGIQERIKAFNGEMMIHSSPHNGMHIRVGMKGVLVND
ncbi:hypothetical protein ACP8HI_10640 [Paenibacillus sp. FA6]